MEAVYPETWNVLKYPNVRGELIEYLKTSASFKECEDLFELKSTISFFSMILILRVKNIL